jgi:Cu/Ag efflux pump CusA
VSLLGAVLVLRLRGETVNVMVMAGIALAVVVLADDVTGDAERIRRRLGERPHGDGRAPKARVVLEASLEGRRPLAYATVIALLALLPIVVLKGEVGAFLPSIAFSYAVAIVVSMIVALTLLPVLALLLLPDSASEATDPPLLARLQRWYAAKVWPLAGGWRGGIAVLGILVVVGAVTLPFLHRGHSLVPSLRDRNLLVQFDGAPGTSLTEMDRVTTRAGRALRKISGVEGVGAQIGRAVLGDRVVETSSSELWVTLKPSADYGAAVGSIRRVVAGFPGIRHSVLTYPSERIDEVLHVPARDLTVRVYGADPTVLRAKANEVRDAVSKVHGVSRATVSLPPQEPTFQVEVNLVAAQRFGVKPGDVRRAAATVLSGLDVGALFQDQKVFDVVVVGTPETRANATNIRDLLIDTPGGGTVRLGDVADVRVASTDTVIDHEDVSRYVDVGMTVSGRDVGAVAGDVRRRIAGVSFPLEHHAVVLNDYSHHRSAFLRFLAVSIAAAIGVFLLLQAATASWRLAVLASVVVPGALAGGLVATALNGGRVSIGTLAGFLVVFTIAIRQFLVTAARCTEIGERDDGSRERVVAQTMRERVAPIVVTTVGAVALLLPYVVFGTSAGYEVIHPMAVTVLGGLLSAAVVNLFVVPALYVRFGPAFEREPEMILDLTQEPVSAPNGEDRVVTTTTSDA